MSEEEGQNPAESEKEPEISEEEAPQHGIEGVKKVVAVASGKGGVGKTTTAVNLAIALAQRGWRVGLFDGDVNGPDVPLMLGVRRRERAEGMGAFVTVASAAPLRKEDKGRALERYGVKVMSIGLLVGEDQPVVPETMMVGKMVLNLMRSIDWDELDILLIDLPPGTGEPQLTLTNVLKLDGVVLVTTPPDVALLDTTKCLNLFRQSNVPILGLVENMSYSICPHCGERLEFFRRSKREGERAIKNADIPILGRIPLDGDLSEAGDDGRPLLITQPDSLIAKAFLDAADAVAKALGL